MTVKDVVYEVERIRSITKDDEGAHFAEDALWGKVLEAIAFGSHDRVQMQEIASAALKTRAIDFARWYS